MIASLAAVEWIFALAMLEAISLQLVKLKFNKTEGKGVRADFQSPRFYFLSNKQSQTHQGGKTFTETSSWSIALDKRLEDCPFRV